MLIALFVTTAGTGGTLPYLWTFLQHQQGLGAAGAGALFTARAVSALAGGLLAGTWVDRYGARRVIVGSALTAAACTLALLAVHGLAFGVPVMVVYGVVGAVLGTALNAQLAQLVAPEQRSRAFALAWTITAAGLAAGAVAGAIIISAWPGSTLTALFGIDAATFAALALLLALGLPGGPASPGNEKPLQQVAGSVGYLVALRDRSLRSLCLLVALVVGAGYCQVSTGLPAYQAAGGSSARALGWVLSANLVTLLILQMPAQRLSARWRPARTLTVGLTLLISAWTALLGPFGHGTATLTLAAVLLAAGEVLLTPVLAARINNLAPEGQIGRYNGAFTLAFTSGWLIGTALTALVASTGNTRLLPVFLVLPLILAAVAVRVADQRPRGTSVHETSGSTSSGAASAATTSSPHRPALDRDCCERGGSA